MRLAKGLVAPLLIGMLLSVTILSSVSAAAIPSPQRIYLHYDYMVLTSGPDPHSDAPDPASIQKVVEAFAQHGIQLIIDPVHKAIPEKEFLIFGPQGDEAICFQNTRINVGNSVNFYDLRMKYFKPENPYVHYAVFGYTVLNNFAGSCPRAGGVAELPGKNFAVGIAGDYLPRPPDGSSPQYPWGVGVPRSPFFEGGTFMHELGHNLGLHHGGADDINYKPNYFSVMSYAYQLRGIMSGDSPGSIVPDPALTRLDYSDKACPTLDENNLDENVGINCGTNDISIFRSPDCGAPQIVPATGAIDWNCDGTIESGIQESLIDFTSFNDPVVLRGFNDWQEVHSCITSGCSFGPVPARVGDPFTSDPSPPGTVTFHTNPTSFLGSPSPGSITACGKTVTDGGSSHCARTFAATANPPSASSDWVFAGWAWDGGVTCDSQSANPVDCVSNGDGSLTGNYYAKVSFLTNPPGVYQPPYKPIGWAPAGSLNFECWADTIYGNGDSTFVPVSSGAVVCQSDYSGYVFTGWSCTGGVLCPAAYSDAVSISGPGSLTANYASSSLLQVDLVGPANGSVVTSSPIPLSAHVHVGSVPVQGVFVVFVIDGVSHCCAFTDLTGTAALSFTPSLVGHTYSWYAYSYAGVTSDIWMFTYGP